VSQALLGDATVVDVSGLRDKHVPENETAIIWLLTTTVSLDISTILNCTT
jgi:hypothetical protein